MCRCEVASAFIITPWEGGEEEGEEALVGWRKGTGDTDATCDEDMDEESLLATFAAEEARFPTCGRNRFFG
jgi:hypothetical protein